MLDYITECSDIIIFSAAIPYQGGNGHINEQRHNYWIEEFAKRNFDYCDSFKSNLIWNEAIFYWLRQNLFIFFKNQPSDSPLKNSKWIAKDFEIVHVNILNHGFGLKEWLKIMPGAIRNSISFRLKKRSL